MISVHLMTVYDTYETNKQNSCKKLDSTLCECHFVSSYCRMPPKADYWKYFTVQGLLALCQIQGCPKPTVSLGSASKNGGKKRKSKSSHILASQYSSSLQLLEV